MNNLSVEKAVSFLDSWLSYRARHVDIPGFSVAILVNNEIIFSHAYGLADVEHKISLTPNHLFHVASQTKMLTATAIMQLLQTDKLALDALACDYLPWLREHRDKRFCDITIRQLLSHSAGLLRDGLDSDYWLFQKQSPTKSGLRKAILAIDLVFVPGSGVKYSNLGYGLLGQIVEAVSEQSFGSYVKESILTPLGLESSVVMDYIPKIQKSIPVGYSLPFERHRNPISTRLPTKSLKSAVGIYTNPESMCYFVSGLFFGNDVLINDDLKREMQQSQSKVESGYDEGLEFGLGHETQMIGDRRVIGHTGHVAGHVSATYFDPDARIAVSVAANAKDAPCASIARGIFGALDFFCAAIAPDNVLAQKSPFNARLFNDLSAVEIIHDGDRIVMIDPDDWEPFAWYESLEIVDRKTLRVTTPGSVYNQGETLQYYFNRQAVTRVRLAGLSFVARPQSLKPDPHLS